jgi:hypothetical protein
VRDVLCGVCGELFNTLPRRCLTTALTNAALTDAALTDAALALEVASTHRHVGGCDVADGPNRAGVFV